MQQIRYFVKKQQLHVTVTFSEKKRMGEEVAFYLQNIMALWENRKQTTLRQTKLLNYLTSISVGMLKDASSA